ncbi:MAG: ribulose-phosphate 3-epimerase [Candidatus Omnitrophota bacterium]
MIKIAPSIIAADQMRLGEEAKKVGEAGADLLHVDIMDGHFVPNITIGPDVVRALDKVTSLPLDVHLMIADPRKYIAAFTQAGADYLTVHIEACGNDAPGIIAQIKKLGVRAGISLNPDTPLTAIEGLLKDVDLVLVMTVQPGFSGQKFMPGVLPKIKLLRGIYTGEIAVDGGINGDTAKEALACGADILAAGSFVFQAKDVRKAISSLRIP